MKVLQTFVLSYPVELLHLCPGSLMRYFKKAGDAAIAAGDPWRCRLLMQWGTTYRVMALSKWYMRITSNPAWNRETLPPEALNFDAEYQGAYDLALQALQESHGVRPRQIAADRIVSDPSQVLVVAVCLYKKGVPLPEMAARNHRLYCDQHGYQYEHFIEVPEGGWEQLGNLPREPHYWKIQQTLTALEREDGPEWVMVIDCDAFFTNASIEILDVARAYGPNALFYMAEDPAGINTGVLLFRRHEWTRAFLRRVLRTPFTQIWDQSQYFWQLLQELNAFNPDEQVRLPEEVALVHQRHLNAYHSGTADSWHAYGWKPGDFVIHYAGCPWDQEPCWKKMQVSARVIEEQLPGSSGALDDDDALRPAPET